MWNVVSYVVLRLCSVWCQQKNFRSSKTSLAEDAPENSLGSGPSRFFLTTPHNISTSHHYLNFRHIFYIAYYMLHILCYIFLDVRDFFSLEWKPTIHSFFITYTFVSLSSLELEVNVHNFELPCPTDPSTKGLGPPSSDVEYAMCICFFDYVIKDFFLYDPPSRSGCAWSSRRTCFEISPFCSLWIDCKRNGSRGGTNRPMHLSVPKDLIVSLKAVVRRLPTEIKSLSLVADLRLASRSWVTWYYPGAMFPIHIVWKFRMSSYISREKAPDTSDPAVGPVVSISHAT